MINLSPCAECTHCSVCKFSDDYIKDVEAFIGFPVGNMTEFDIKCKYFNRNMTKPRYSAGDPDRLLVK